MYESEAHIPNAVPASLAKEHGLRILKDDGQTIELEADTVLSPGVLDELAFLTGRLIQQASVREKPLESGAQESSTPSTADGPAKAENPSNVVGGVSAGALQAQSQRRTRGDAPVRRLDSGTVTEQVDHIIRSAVKEGASDIHFEPYETLFRVRYRIDGVLQTVGHLNLSQKDAIISRLKIMASLDIAERRRPQDSRIQVRHGKRNVDLRVSTLPTAHGEKVVLRILDKSAIQLDLSRLGLTERDLQSITRAIRRPNGQVLVTGPTGSGKTTTLYAALNALNTDAVNITTIEDPVEYNLTGVNQTRVRADIGFTFAQALRAFLRQDPNVIMVGEIRDHETAEVAVRAALTGHLVLSTLHTNDAPSTVVRLVDMGIEPYLVAASVRLVVAQRLVRRVCAACAQTAFVEASLLSELGIAEGTKTVQGEGCTPCSGTGFQGRTALFEVMPLSERIGEMVAGGASAYAIRAQAHEEGLRTLREAGADAVRRGITTPEEVLREVAA